MKNKDKYFSQHQVERSLERIQRGLSEVNCGCVIEAITGKEWECLGKNPGCCPFCIKLWLEDEYIQGVDEDWKKKLKEQLEESQSKKLTLE